MVYKEPFFLGKHKLIWFLYFDSVTLTATGLEQQMREASGKKTDEADLVEGTIEAVKYDLKKAAEIKGIMTAFKHKDLEELQELEEILKKLNSQLTKKMLSNVYVDKGKGGLKTFSKIVINYYLNEIYDYKNSETGSIAAKINNNAHYEIFLPVEDAYHFFKNFECKRKYFCEDFGSIRPKYFDKLSVFEQPKKGLIIRDVLLDTVNGFLFMIAQCHGSVGGCFLQTYNYLSHELLYSLRIQERSKCFIRATDCLKEYELSKRPKTLKFPEPRDLEDKISPTKNTGIIRRRSSTNPTEMMSSPDRVFEPKEHNSSFNLNSPPAIPENAPSNIRKSFPKTKSTDEILSLASDRNIKTPLMHRHTADWEQSQNLNKLDQNRRHRHTFTGAEEGKSENQSYLYPTLFYILTEQGHITRHRVK